MRKLYNKLYRCQKKKKTVEGNILYNQVKPAISNTLSSKMVHHRVTFGECEPNIRNVLSAFYIGTGGEDVAKVLGMLGVGEAL